MSTSLRGAVWGSGTFWEVEPYWRQYISMGGFEVFMDSLHFLSSQTASCIHVKCDQPTSCSYFWAFSDAWRALTIRVDSILLELQVKLKPSSLKLLLSGLSDHSHRKVMIASQLSGGKVCRELSSAGR